MILKNINKINKRQFLNLCLAIFSEFKSATFIQKNNKEQKITFWKKRKSLLKFRSTISIFDLLYKHIPMQLSYYNWGTSGLYSEYFEEIDKLDKDLYIINKWLESKLDNLKYYSFINQQIIQSKIYIDKETKTAKYKRLNPIISIKTDKLDSTIQRISEYVNNINLKNIVLNSKMVFKAAIIATLIHLSISFSPLQDKEIITFKIKDKIISFNGKLKDSIICDSIYYMIKSKNLTTSVIFDSS